MALASRSQKASTASGTSTGCRQRWHTSGRQDTFGLAIFRADDLEQAVIKTDCDTTPGVLDADGVLAAGQADQAGGTAGRSSERRHDNPGKGKDKAKAKDK